MRKGILVGSRFGVFGDLLLLGECRIRRGRRGWSLGMRVALWVRAGCGALSMRTNSVFLSEETLSRLGKMRRVYQRDRRSAIRGGHFSRVCAAEAAATICRENRGRVVSGNAFF